MPLLVCHHRVWHHEARPTSLESRTRGVFPIASAVDASVVAWRTCVGHDANKLAERHACVLNATAHLELRLNVRLKALNMIVVHAATRLINRLVAKKEREACSLPCRPHVAKKVAKRALA